MGSKSSGENILGVLETLGEVGAIAGGVYMVVARAYALYVSQTTFDYGLHTGAFTCKDAKLAEKMRRMLAASILLHMFDPKDTSEQNAQERDNLHLLISQQHGFNLSSDDLTIHRRDDNIYQPPDSQRGNTLLAKWGKMGMYALRGCNEVLAAQLLDNAAKGLSPEQLNQVNQIISPAIDGFGRKVTQHIDNPIFALAAFARQRGIQGAVDAWKTLRRGK